MKNEKKKEILLSIKEGRKFSRNNPDMAYLQANGYITARNVKNWNYRNANINLTEWGEVWLKANRND